MQKASLKSPFYIFLLPLLTFFSSFASLVHLKSSSSSSTPIKNSTFCPILPAFSQPRENWKWAIFLLNWSQKEPLPHPSTKGQNIQGENLCKWGWPGRVVWNIPHEGGLAWEMKVEPLPEWWSQPGPATCCGTSGTKPGVFVLLRSWWKGAGPVASAHSVLGWLQICFLALLLGLGTYALLGKGRVNT